MKKIDSQPISFKDSLKNRNFLILYILILFLLFLFITASIWLYTTYRTTKSYESYVLQIANLNKETIFSLDSIFIFSSATATNHADSQALWSLDIHQFSDISLFIVKSFDTLVPDDRESSY